MKKQIILTLISFLLVISIISLDLYINKEEPIKEDKNIKPSNNVNPAGVQVKEPSNTQESRPSSFDTPEPPTDS